MVVILLYIYSFLFISVLFKGKEYLRIQKYTCFFLLFVFFGFRDLPVLNDTGHYYEEFMYVASNESYLKSSIFSIDAFNRFEPGFQVFEKFIAKYISKDPYSIIIISSLISSIVILWLINFFTHKVALTVFLLLSTSVLFYYFNNIRQGFASYLFWLGLIILIKKSNHSRFIEWKWDIVYSVLCVMAILFHYSAIVVFIPLLFFKVTLKKRNVVLVIILGFIFSFSTYYLMRIAGLSDIDYYERGLNRETTSLGPLLNASLQIVFTIICFLLTKRYKIAIEYPIIWWLVILSCIFSVASVMNGILGRFAIYFSIFIIIQFVYCIERIPHHLKKLIQSIVVIVLFIRASILLDFRPEWNHLYPYGFFDFSKTYHEYRIYD